MGEYIKYKGEEIKIGTMENLYYTTYQKYIEALKSGRLAGLYGSSPGEYAQPDSGFRFRFPFPDEDKLSLGDIGDQHYYRGLPVKINQADIAGDGPDTKLGSAQHEIEITQQKLVHRQSDGMLCLALVCRNTASGQSFRIEDDADMKALLKQIISNHVLGEPNTEKRYFYRNVAFRILKGYRMEQPEMKIRQKALPKHDPAQLKSRKRRKGKGI